MVRNRGRRVETEQMKPQNVINDFTDICRRILGENLVGVYLHGSAAMGCFHPKLSDLDFIAVVEESVPDAAKLDFLGELVPLHAQAPAKGIEMSIVRREFCERFAYPTPFELHFSAMHLNRLLKNPQAYAKEMKGTDKDLAAHFTVLKKCGIVLWGKRIEAVFGAVPPEAYTDSICGDIENAPEEIAENPMYMTLNLCRVLAWLQKGAILSKREGGEWGLAALPQEFRGLPALALRCYEAGEEMKIEPEAGKRFAAYMKKEILRIRDSRERECRKG